MFEYKVIPAPRQGQKAKGVKAPEDRFSLALETVMNTQAADGWEFVRAETLPSDERSGFRSTTTVYRSVLVFRRALLEEAAVEDDAVYAPAPPVAPQEPEEEIVPEELAETLEEQDEDAAR